MKKCIFYLTTTIFALFFCKKAYTKTDFFPFFEKVVLSVGVNANLKLQDFQNSNYNFSVQDFSVKFKDISFQSSLKSSSTKITQVPKINAPVWLVDFPFKSLKIPISFKTGTISASGSFQELKNPAFSSSLIQNGTKAKTSSNLSIRKTTSSAPLAFSMHYNQFFPYTLQKIQIDSFVNCENLFSTSIFASFKLDKKSNLNFSNTIAKYSAKNTTSSWFSPTRLFVQNYFWANNFQFALNLPKNKIKISTNFFQSPYRLFDFTAKLEQTFSVPFFSLNSAIFYASSKDIFTVSQSVLKTLFQFKISPQIVFVNSSQNSIFSMGFTFLAEEKIQKDYSTKLLLKQGLNFHVRKKTSIQKITLSIENFQFSPSVKDLFFEKFVFSPANSFEKSTYKIGYSNQLQGRFSPFFSIKVSNSPEEKEFFSKIASSVIFSKKTNTKLKTSFETTFQEKELKKTNFAFSFSTGFYNRYIKINCIANIKFYLE